MLGLRAHRDLLRKEWMQNVDTAPTRSIVYTRHIDNVDVPLEAFVTGEELNKDLPDDQKVNAVTFSGLILVQEPTKLDKILFSGRTYAVREWKLLGELYTVVAENNKRNKVTSRKFKAQ